jgi:hypothetical protein
LGYRSGSANFRSVVNIALIKEKRFRSAGRGLYQLDGATAASQRSRKAKRKNTKRQSKKKSS